MEKNINNYLNLYNTYFEKIKDNKISLLEIVRNKNQNNIWNDYFKNGEIYKICKEDAYNNDYISKNFNNKKFNVIIEKSSYDLDSLIKFIKIYSNLLNNNGILIIENIQSIRYLPILRDNAPLKLHPFIEAYDLRDITEIYDDVFFIINKTNNLEEPINNQEEINNKPDEPINNQEEINNKPDEPINNQKEINNKPNEPINNQEEINNKPEEINNKPNEPINNQEEINNKPEEPINNQEEINNKPDLFMDIFEILFRRKKESELLLLNIGLNEERIKYLINYFNNSLLFGIGVKNDIDTEIKDNNRIKLYLGTSPFDINLESSNIRFDIIICNNENEIIKIIFIINTYSKILNKNGILIIEDINENDIPKIRENIDIELKDIMETYNDGNKNIIIINK